MPRGKIKVLKANAESVILEATISAYYRIEIPKSIQQLLEPGDLVQVTIKKVKR